MPDCLGRDPVTEFTDAEQMVLRNLPRKNYLVQNEHSVVCSLVDLLLAYAYDHITTEGEVPPLPSIRLPDHSGGQRQGGPRWTILRGR